ncbi:MULTISPECIES: DUF982 domain-containing protein [unclassified Rhizobium]|uniref:DUF982 domain-containing protein n=1 Tax=unclassified Rhizobium TaxID=2613769 RepID=UPI0016184305|nr:MULTISPECIES: DUF982 domain-containing protein [unclassified Rhizobium]MBB3318851.1 hypothetical protein [Rhizobium sp. BK181]MBB3545520.1 hypothetical protein [Rhizobium sp. BK399]MCS3744381.1 hypothetical protein [Rhizobium sp. BK661]MCS4096703.1 hypothetical protein [Rhizobium sp. BK176]
MNWHRSDIFAPLMLVVGGREKYRLVSSLREAAEALIGDWPSDDGEEYMEAVKICLDAIHGKLTAHEAREALIRAADEAGIPVIRVVH